MKNKIFLMAMFVAIFTGCKVDEPKVTKVPEVFNSSVTAEFSVTVKQPMTIVLTNHSDGATEYSWDFGDGKTSSDKNPTHRYTNIGVYKVKLTARNIYNATSTYEKNVTIEEPTTCYVTGLSITKIPTNNVYYQVQLTDDYIMSKTTYFYTDWYLLSSTTNLPYIHMFSNKKVINISKKYMIRLYKSSTKPSGQASGKGDYSAEITSTQLKKYPEKVTWSTTNVGMEIYLEWQ
jgi:PKD repeat protein